MAKKKIILLSSEPGSFIQEELEKANPDLEVVPVMPEDCVVDLSDKEVKVFVKDQDISTFDLCLPRVSEINIDFKVNVLNAIRAAGIPVVNTPESVMAAGNKIECQLLLAKAGIKTPKTMMMGQTSNADSVIEGLGGKFPIILKTAFGCHGVGVMKIESKQSLVSVVDYLSKTEEIFLVQEYIEHDSSQRILVMGDNAAVAVNRTIPEDDFRSNAKRGADLSFFEPAEDEVDVCVRACQAIGVKFGAVDYIKNEAGDIVVFEVNSSPGFEKMQEVTEFNIAEKLAEYLLTFEGKEFQPNADLETSEENEEEKQDDQKDEEPDENPEDQPTQEDQKPEAPVTIKEPEKEKAEENPPEIIGTVADVTVKYFNDEKPIECRVDTGAEYSSINGQDIEVDDNTVTFTFENYRYRFSIIRFVKILSSNGESRRPVIMVDIQFGDDHVVPNAEFTVADREGLK